MLVELRVIGSSIGNTVTTNSKYRGSLNISDTLRLNTSTPFISGIGMNSMIPFSTEKVRISDSDEGEPSSNTARSMDSGSETISLTSKSNAPESSSTLI